VLDPWGVTLIADCDPPPLPPPHDPTPIPHLGKRVIVVKAQGSGKIGAGTGSDGPGGGEPDTAVTHQSRVSTLRAGAAAAVARLRSLSGVSSAAVDLASVASCLPGAPEAEVASGQGAVVQSTLLANYAFDKYATTPASKKRLRTLSRVVRKGLPCLAHP
jgi:hypothetical protein